MRKIFKLLRQLLVIVILVLALPVGVYLATNPTSFLKLAFGTKADLQIDVNSITPSSPLWANLAQGGEEAHGMLTSVKNEVRELSPQYIRIDHVYDFYNVVYRNPDGSLGFNWQDLDTEINDIREIGALPFISLSYMPTAISSGNEVAPPKNWSEWENVVRQTIEHISGTNGLGLSDVYYEVWNEPDLFGGFKLSGDRKYMDMYYYASRGATLAQNVNDFKFGGPATTGLYKNWIYQLIDANRVGKVRLDFLSWHKYSNSMEDFDSDVENLRLWLSENPGYEDIELVVTETGYSSENNPAHDLPLSAIHTLSTMAAYDGTVSKAFSFEIKDGPGDNKYWGRWGILTHEKYGPPSVKPRFEALRFLNQMTGDRLNIVGQGSWVRAMGRREGNTIRLLVVNYDQNAKNFEAVPIKFYNLNNTTYVYRKINFLGKTTETQFEPIDSEWSIKEGFAANTASILEIYPVNEPPQGR